MDCTALKIIPGGNKLIWAILKGISVAFFILVCVFLMVSSNSHRYYTKCGDRMASRPDDHDLPPQK